MSSSEKILITSALPYVNNVPHLGNMIGAVLSADVFARFCRLTGKETLFICGADEHGTATETKAKQENISPKKLCDRFYALHKEIYEWFGISFDNFGRTSEKNHHDFVQELLLHVFENDYLEEKTLTQPYSVQSQMFLADRFIVGTCPHCQYEDARGDQCDSCGKLLTPQELLEPRSALDNTTPEFRETTHLFLRLDKLQPQLEAWVQKQQEQGFWTENTKRTTQAWFTEKLQPRAITRDLKWGIPVPESILEGRFKDKVVYVWFDAPLGYISLTEQLLGTKARDWWTDKNTKLYQFMGKDNIPFHSIIFPATLLAARTASTDDFILPYHINATEYLNYENTKFSKSRGVGVFGDQARDTGIPADVWRYTLLFYRPEQGDTQFTWKGLQERLNNELIANFGNFVNRTLSFTARFFESTIESLQEADLSDVQREFLVQWKESLATYKVLFEQVRLREALMQLMKMSSMCNTYFQQAQPWKTRTTAPETAQKDIAFLNHLVKDLAIISEPFLPHISKEIFSQLGIEPRLWDDFGKLSIGKHVIATPKTLFSKLEDEDVEQLQQRFAGASASRGPRTSDLDLRVGKIIEIIKHPKADKLYIEKVDLGDKVLQIVSGLVPYYTEEELLGKHIVVVNNLKPAKLRGELSEGMLLAAEDREGNVAVVTAPNAKLGERVRSEKQGAPKKELSFEDFTQYNFLAKKGQVFINDEKLAAKNSQLVIDKGILDGNVS